LIGGEEVRTLAAVTIALVLALPSWGARPRHASLHLASRSPLAVQGRGFGAGEPVSLTAATAGAVRTVRFNASREGRFRALFDLRVARCGRLLVRAIGGLGSRAVLQVEPGCKEKERKRR
jgi:hypothetical protein